MMEEQKNKEPKYTVVLFLGVIYGDCAEYTPKYEAYANNYIKALYLKIYLRMQIKGLYLKKTKIIRNNIKIYPVRG
jgi:hypothetical protein